MMFVKPCHQVTLMMQIFVLSNSYVFFPIQLFVWNRSSCTPYQRYSEHCAAVKAISWSPHQHGLLASGGGTADRTIRFWNTLTGTQIQSVDTGSQVSNTYSIHIIAHQYQGMQHLSLTWPCNCMCVWISMSTS